MCSLLPSGIAERQGKQTCALATLKGGKVSALSIVTL